MHFAVSRTSARSRSCWVDWAAWHRRDAVTSHDSVYVRSWPARSQHDGVHRWDLVLALFIGKRERDLRFAGLTCRHEHTRLPVSFSSDQYPLVRGAHLTLHVPTLLRELLPIELEDLFWGVLGLEGDQESLLGCTGVRDDACPGIARDIGREGFGQGARLRARRPFPGKRGRRARSRPGGWSARGGRRRRHSRFPTATRECRSGSRERCAEYKATSSGRLHAPPFFEPARSITRCDPLRLRAFPRRTRVSRRQSGRFGRPLQREPRRVPCPQRPSNFGARRSVKAATPSLKSRLLKSGRSCRKTWCTLASKVSSWPRRIMRLVACTASGALAAISAARTWTSFARRSSGTTRETSPRDTHSSARSVRPVKAISQARDQPTSRGKSQVPPLSGKTPRFAKAGASFALAAAIRMSQPRARSMP